MYNLYENIIIVENKKNQGYIVEYNNKKQLEAARKWCKKKVAEYKTKNEGFQIELFQSVGDSTKSVTSSFWNCKVKKEDKCWIVGISSECVLQMLLQLNCFEGKFQEMFSFARYNGKLYVITEKMNGFSEYKTDMLEKSYIQKNKKISKHIPGRNYMTINYDEIFLFTGYERLFVSNEYVEGNKKIKELSLLKNPIPRYFYISTSQYYEKLENNISSYLDKYIYEDRKMMPRVEGSLQLTNDLTNDIINDYFYWRIKTLEDFQFVYFNYFYYTANPDDVISIPSDITKRLKNNHIKINL